MHLHARTDVFHPSSGEFCYLPTPPHMSATWDFFGFDEGMAEDTFNCRRV